MAEKSADDVMIAPPDPERFAVTDIEYYHLLKAEGPVLTIWNARDLNVPSAPKKIDVPGLPPSFQAFDMGCCLVVGPVSIVE